MPGEKPPFFCFCWSAMTSRAKARLIASALVMPLRAAMLLRASSISSDTVRESLGMALLLSDGLMDVVPQFAVCTLNRGQEGKTFSHSLGRKRTLPSGCSRSICLSEGHPHASADAAGA